MHCCVPSLPLIQHFDLSLAGAVIQSVAEQLVRRLSSHLGFYFFLSGKNTPNFQTAHGCQ